MFLLLLHLTLQFLQASEPYVNIELVMFYDSPVKHETYFLFDLFKCLLFVFVDCENELNVDQPVEFAIQYIMHDVVEFIRLQFSEFYEMLDVFGYTLSLLLIGHWK